MWRPLTLRGFVRLCVRVFKSFIVSPIVGLWLNETHPELSPVCRVEDGNCHGDQSGQSALGVRGQVVDVSNLVAWFVASERNQRELKNVCINSVRIHAALYAGYVRTCRDARAQNVTRLDEIYSAKQFAYDALEIQARNNFVMDVLLKANDETLQNYSDSLLGQPLPTVEWCLRASNQLLQYEIMKTQCTAIDSIAVVAGTLGRSMAAKCVPKTHYEGIRWFSIFSLKSIGSALLSGVIISFSCLAGSEAPWNRRRKLSANRNLREPLRRRGSSIEF